MLFVVSERIAGGFLFKGVAEVSFICGEVKLYMRNIIKSKRQETKSKQKKRKKRKGKEKQKKSNG